MLRLCNCWFQGASGMVVNQADNSMQHVDSTESMDNMECIPNMECEMVYNKYYCSIIILNDEHLF